MAYIDRNDLIAYLPAEFIAEFSNDVPGDIAQAETVEAAIIRAACREVDAALAGIVELTEPLDPKYAAVVQTAACRFALIIMGERRGKGIISDANGNARDMRQDAVEALRMAVARASGGVGDIEDSDDVFGGRLP